MAWMVEAPMPLARASPANCCFQASKPPAELPHCAAFAGEDRDARRTARTREQRAMAWRKKCMGEPSSMWVPEYQVSLLARLPDRFERCGKATWPISFHKNAEIFRMALAII